MGSFHPGGRFTPPGVWHCGAYALCLAPLRCEHMMANAWRDPAWRGAFLLLGRMTATNGDCAIPTPPDGTPKAHLNPFANADCSSTFNLGSTTQTTTNAGSLLDDFCSRCHMPSNYVDQVALDTVHSDPPSGLEHGLVRSTFDPTSDNGTGVAFATVEALLRNTESGKAGIVCEVCHTYVESRHTPYHSFPKSGLDYVPAPGKAARETLVAPRSRTSSTSPMRPSPPWAGG